MRYKINKDTHIWCNATTPHPHHIFPTGTIREDYVEMAQCAGQWVHCTNCDDQGCMDCVLRYEHDKCEWSCPFCSKGDADYLRLIDPYDEDGQIQDDVEVAWPH